MAGKTGMSENVFLPPRMDLYLCLSRMAREIYADYTDRQEPFGCDECWLDVSDSADIKEERLHIAQKISDRIKKKLGITVSIGVSFNKIFAKSGSDYKKPDAIAGFLISHQSLAILPWQALMQLTSRMMMPT